LYINSEIYSWDSGPSAWGFEDRLIDICHKIKGHYLLKCCFGCLYSNYSPAGNGDFGTMLCYSRVADQYLKVSGKYGDNPIWKVYDKGEQRQETSLCEHFRPRINCLGGYRGLIYGSN